MVVLLLLSKLLEVAVVAVDPSDKWPSLNVVASLSLRMQPLMIRLQRFIISLYTASSQVRFLATSSGHSNQMGP